MSAESEPATSDLLLLLHVVEDVRDHFIGELFVDRLLVVDLLLILLFLVVVVLFALYCPLFDVAAVFVVLVETLFNHSSLHFAIAFDFEKCAAFILC